MSEAALRVNQLTVAISGTRILSQISFELKQLETVGIIGPNGSGKTTLFNALGGFVKAEAGEIFLHGEELTDLAPHRRALLGLGRVFQNTGIFKELTLEENLLLALEAKDGVFRSLIPGVSSLKSRKEQVQYELESIGLIDKRPEKAGVLSGGQLRLLEISRALLFGAKVMLLDEPTAGVAPGMKEKVGEVIAGISKKGCTVVVIEHDLRFIESLVQRILVVNQGSIVIDGETASVRGDQRLQQIYFG